MRRTFVPQPVVDLAHARREARGRGEWARADELRAEIEEAGWLVVDHGVDFELRPAVEPDIVQGGVVRYGASSSVPSRLAEAPSAAATVVIVADPGTEADVDGPGQLRELDGLDALNGLTDFGGAAGCQVVVVANGIAPDPGWLAGLEAPGIEVVPTARRLAPGSARNAGLRRSIGSIVAVVEASGFGGLAAAARRGADAQPLDAMIGEALADGDVAIAGAVGLTSDDCRTFRPATERLVAATGAWIGFRRSDYVDRGPFDERFRTVLGLDIWWSLVLRDQGESRRPRRCVEVDLRTASRAGAAPSAAPPTLQDRAGGAELRPDRRDAYRILDRFGRRPDLMSR